MWKRWVSRKQSLVNYSCGYAYLNICIYNYTCIYTYIYRPTYNVAEDKSVMKPRTRRMRLYTVMICCGLHRQSVHACDRKERTRHGSQQTPGTIKNTCVELLHCRNGSSLTRSSHHRWIERNTAEEESHSCHVIDLLRCLQSALRAATCVLLCLSMYMLPCLFPFQAVCFCRCLCDGSCMRIVCITHKLLDIMGLSSGRHLTSEIIN